MRIYISEREIGLYYKRATAVLVHKMTWKEKKKKKKKEKIIKCPRGDRYY
jgi:hypothetical protein